MAQMNEQHIQLQDDQQPAANQQLNQLNANPAAQIEPQLYKQARSNFAFKVYSIVAMELFTTAIFVTITMANPEYAEFQRKTPVLAGLASVITFGSMAMICTMFNNIMCKRQLSEKFPTNMIILAIFTLAQSYTVSSICAMYKEESVIIAAGVTAAATMGITVYVRFTGSDLFSCRSIMGGVGSSLLMAAMFISFASFFIKIELITTLISLGLAIVFPLYLIFDTQMILENIKHNISLDQYVLASVFLYVDIIGIFLDILRLIGQRRRS